MIASDVWTAGIDFSLPGNGGPACSGYLSSQRKVGETLVGLLLSAFGLHLGFKLLSAPPSPPSPPSPTSKTRQTSTSASSKTCADVLFWAMLITYLVELGYKFYTYQAIFSLNPCHCLCVVQLYILSGVSKCLKNNQDPNPALLYVFRIHLYFLHGPLMAVIFPVTNTLFLPGEVATYWIEHALLLGIPVFLLKFTGLTVPSRSLADQLGWGLMAFGIWGAFHYLFLQPLAIVTQANLNSMLCPAITDPFRGPNYRAHAIWHQAVITVLCGIGVNVFGNSDKDKDNNLNETDKKP